MHNRVQLYQGDITHLTVDAIVNAANTSLLGGGGVDGAIHRAAGPELLAECKSLNGCATGEAKITRGYKLNAPYVIHTVGPRWRGGKHNEVQLLANCYTNSLTLAQMYHIKTIAFPNISTGIYGFPKYDAATIAITTTLNYLNTHAIPEKIIFVVFDEDNLRIYQQLLNSK
jgi:O-acetyl-ADP-ribose deacetylase